MSEEAVAEASASTTNLAQRKKRQWRAEDAEREKEFSIQRGKKAMEYAESDDRRGKEERQRMQYKRM